MRLRNIPGAEEAVKTSPFVIQEPETYKGRWQEAFGSKQPIRIEIGCGKGNFITTMAREHPERNYIAIELFSSVLYRALQKQEEEKLPNLLLIRMDAMLLPEVFAQGAVEGSYLNFSDPWPKERHARRRLTSTFFLRQYEQILTPQGRVEFKTDNRKLFDFSLEQLELAGWKTLFCTTDLHADASMNAGNILTEYEKRFSERGNPICKFIACRGEASGE